MPQLDKITFLSQYFWLLIFYIGFFLLIQKIYLPRFGRILLYREKKISSIDTNHSATQKGAAPGDLFDKISGQLSNELTDLLNTYFSTKSITSGTHPVASDSKMGTNGAILKFSQPLYNRYCDSFFELLAKNRISIDPTTGSYHLVRSKNKKSSRYGNRHPFFYFFFKKANTIV